MALLTASVETCVFKQLNNLTNERSTQQNRKGIETMRSTSNNKYIDAKQEWLKQT